MTLEKQNDTLITAEVRLIDAETGKPLNLNVVIHATERDVKMAMPVIQKGILELAGKNYAKDGDNIIINKKPTGFEFHFKAETKRFGTGTVGGDLLKMCKWIEAHSTYKSNDLLRLLMTSTDRLTSDFIGAVFGKMNSLLPGSPYVAIKNISKPNRYSGQCYKNALDEYRSTGNEPLIVMECCLSNSGYAMVVPHAINYNAETKEYYDTNCDGSLRRGERMAWIIRRGEALMDWYAIWEEDWRKTEQYANTYGGYSFVWMDDKFITVHTKGIDCDRIDEVKTLQSVVVEPMRQWSHIGWRESAVGQWGAPRVSDMD
jgi:hypothetical protein